LASGRFDGPRLLEKTKILSSHIYVCAVNYWDVRPKEGIP
jgi:hypothetical protein